MRLIAKITILILLSVNLFSFSFFSYFSSNVSSENLLAISWQENFCKLNSYKRECKRFRKNDFGWNNFVLHGLWPQPRSKHNCSNKYKRLDNDVFRQLKIAMPSVASGLQKHEWRKHGSCYGKSERNYFMDAMSLLKQINKSKIRDFFIANRGRVITKKSLNMAIKKSFGNVTRKVRMICVKGLITELRFSLKGEVSKNNLPALLKNAQALIGGCQKGRI